MTTPTPPQINQQISLQQAADTDSANSAATNQKLERLYRSCFVRLGGTRIRVELEDEDYENAWDIAVRTYRNLSANSVYRTFAFIILDTNNQIYILPDAVDNVVSISRSGGIFGAGEGTPFDPWNAATANLILRDARPASGFMGLATYDFYCQFIETMDRLFAREINFIFRPDTHTLCILQTPKGPEHIMCDVSVLRSYDELLSSHFSRKWLEDYTLANLKISLGRKYGKFTQLPGAQGGTTLGGDKLLQEGFDEIKQLEQDILDFKDGGSIPLPIMG